jgi:hypothetical protein
MYSSSRFVCAHIYLIRREKKEEKISYRELDIVHLLLTVRRKKTIFLFAASRELILFSFLSFSHADICHMAMDQREVNMLARDYCNASGRSDKPIILSYRILPLKRINIVQ